MLKAIGFEDMGVVKEFTEGSHLVGTCDVAGLWPKKFAPTTMTIDELHGAAAKERERERERERELQSRWHVGVGDVDIQKSVSTDSEGSGNWGTCWSHEFG